jgi:hypothetical protein
LLEREIRGEPGDKPDAKTDQGKDNGQKKPFDGAYGLVGYIIRPDQIQRGARP